MNGIPKRKCIVLVIVFTAFVYFPVQGFALHQKEVTEGKKVLVVASYHSGYKWVEDILKALQDHLQESRMHVFYMDTKKNLAGAKKKAEEAFQIYQEMKPDAVITIDDNAQEYFVVPFLKDKVETPVVFCGVNDDATKYGFPASNVTGVLEKKHYREGISFARIIDPTIEHIAVLYRKSPSNDANLAQIRRENTSYPATVTEFVEVKTLAEARRAAVTLNTRVDALLLLNMTGITDENEQQIEGHDAIAEIAKLSKLITIGASDWEVEAGALCGVIKSGDEQGTLAADMLHSLWEGKTIQDLPVKQNKNGQRYLNVNTLKNLDMKLKPEMIIGTRIITPH